MKMTDPNDDMLDGLFAQAREIAPPVSDRLMDRVLVDAVPPQRHNAARPGFWSGLLDVVGGWSAIGGLVTAMLAGFWIGVAPPSAVTDFTAGLLGDTVTVHLGSASGLADFGGLEDG